MENWNYFMPTRIRFGWGCIGEIKELVESLGGGSVFLVTGKRSARQSGVIDRICESLGPQKVIAFDRVEENPTIETVDTGAQHCRQGGCGVVVGLGGGSSLDAGKAIAMLQKNSGSVREYLDGERTCKLKGLPYIAIPTTSGTGSEVTPFAVISHPGKKTKPAIAPAHMFPDLALVDPQLTVSMPPAVTASSGLDALDQAIEGFWSKRANAMTRSLSGRAIVLAMRNLETAFRDKDPEAVTNMALASHLTGIQMSQIANTAIHPLSYPFTIDYGVSHGFACAIFLPAFIRFNAPAIRDIFADVLAALRIPSVEALADAVESLMEKLGAPRRLREFGVTDAVLPTLIPRGIGKSTEWNPTPLTEKDLLQICRTIL
jgi:alcohol dehydrogenase